MRKVFVTTAIALLSSASLLAQSGKPSTNDGSQYPSSAPSAQQPEKSQTPTADQGTQTIQGCLDGAANTFTLTDESGKVYELTGATSQLEQNVGHKVQLWGAEALTGGGRSRGTQSSFGVKKVKSLSDTCK